MKVSIRNFGPIREYEFDTSKDFHLIFGENNIGKSYAITLVYLVLKSIISDDNEFRFIMFLSDEIEDCHRSSMEKIKKIKNPSLSVDITDEFSKILLQKMNSGFISELDSSIKASFENTSFISQYTSDPFEVTLESDSISIKLGHDEGDIKALSVSIREKILAKISKTNRTPLIKNGSITIYHNTGNVDNFSKYFIGTIFSFVRRLSEDVRESTTSVHFLPASRSGLYQALSAFGQIVAELSQSRAFLKKKIELPSIPEPLTDYFLELSEIKSSGDGFAQDKGLSDVASYIEEEILKGKVSFDQETKKIIYSPNNTALKLDATLTSSMVSEISPIVSYLKYILPFQSNVALRMKGFGSIKGGARRKRSKNDSRPVLFIEEPEAHLHPSIQIKLIEALSMLIGRGVRVVLTTHSNFIYMKVNNLIMSGSIRHEDVRVSIFQRSDAGGIARSLLVDDLGFDDEIFGNTLDELMEERVSILKKRGSRV